MYVLRVGGLASTVLDRVLVLIRRVHIQVDSVLQAVLLHQTGPIARLALQKVVVPHGPRGAVHLGQIVQAVREVVAVAV